MPDASFRPHLVCAHGQIVTYEALLDTVGACLRRRYCGQPHARKRLALDYDVPEQTARNWLEKKGLPNALNLARMMQADPEMFRAVCALTGHADEARQVTPELWQVLMHMGELLAGHCHAPARRAA